MNKIKTRERCYLPMKDMIASFKKQGYDIAVLNNSDRETLIAHDSKCIAYFYFEEDEPEEKKEELITDIQRIKKIRWINNFVFKCIGDYIKNNTPDNTTYPYDLFVDRIEPFEFNDRPKDFSQVAYFDIRHAYLQVAYRLGYFDRKSYFKLLSLYPEYKLEICAAITTLSKRVQCTYYKKGSSKNVSHVIDCNYIGIKEIRNNIIDATHFLLYKVCNENNIQVFLRNVDSIVINKRDAKKVSKALDSMSVKYKRVEGMYVGSGLIRQDDNKLFEAGDALMENISL